MESNVSWNYWLKYVANKHLAKIFTDFTPIENFYYELKHSDLDVSEPFFIFWKTTFYIKGQI